MANTIICPHCKKELELSEALQHQIEEQILVAEREKHKLEVENARKEEQLKATEKTKSEYEFQMKTLREENFETKESKEKLQEQLLGMTREVRKIRQDAEDQRLNLEKKLSEEQEKIRLEERRRIDDEHRLKDLEKDKKLQDAIKVNEELRRKLEQGSQQTQGEVLELELEELLKKEFPTDEIKPVPKGVRGADVIQTVYDRAGRMCGTILWESKNAKWSEPWLAKLKEDQRTLHADTAVLVSVNLPADITTFRFRNGIWVVSRPLVIGLASVLRINIGQVFHAKLANEGKNEKMEVLFNYLTSNEFVHRIETMFDVYKNQREDLEKEKRWFTSKWAKQDKEIDKGMKQIAGMHGDLEGLLGTSTMPQIKGLEMMELQSGE